MKNKRHNVGTIAEILIDKLDEMEKFTQRLEKVAAKAENTTLKIDASEIKRLITEQKEAQKQFLEKYMQISSKQQKRLPNGLLAVVVGALLIALIMGTVLYFKSGIT